MISCLRMTTTTIRHYFWITPAAVTGNFHVPNTSQLSFDPVFDKNNGWSKLHGSSCLSRPPASNSCAIADHAAAFYSSSCCYRSPYRTLHFLGVDALHCSTGTYTRMPRFRKVFDAQRMHAYVLSFGFRHSSVVRNPNFGCRSLAGQLSLTCTRSMLGRWPICG